MAAVKYIAITESDSSMSRTSCPLFKKRCPFRNSVFYVSSMSGFQIIIVLLPWLPLYSFVRLERAEGLLLLNVVVFY
jgi:hypothetical protein